MTRIGVGIFLAFILVAMPHAAFTAEKDAPRFEVTPFVGYRDGGNFDLDDDTRNVRLDGATSFGLALNLRIDEVSQYELFYDRQTTDFGRDGLLEDTDVDIEYLHIGGTVLADQFRRVVPYGVGGLGVTRFRADSPASRDDARFSISLGGGVRVPFTSRFALRLEARGYLTLVDADTAFFCRSDEGGALCRVRGKGSTLFQYEVLAGAAFSF